MKIVRLRLVKHLVALTVFFGVCTMVGQISVLAVDIPISSLGISHEQTMGYFRWSGALKGLLALTLAFYLSRKSLGEFDRFLDKRRANLTSHRKAISDP